MSMFDKTVAKVTPPESDEARAEARARARAAAEPGDWLSLALEHHLQIEDGFAAVREAGDAASRHRALKSLAVVLTGHSLAEETVLYPALVIADEKAHATSAYTQQSAAKVQMAELETLDPEGEDFRDKFEHVVGAVTHHVYEEEGTWFLELRDKLPAAEQARLTARFREEYQRYVGDDALPAGMPSPLPSRSDARPGAGTPAV